MFFCFLPFLFIFNQMGERSVRHGHEPAEVSKFKVKGAAASPASAMGPFLLLLASDTPGLTVCQPSLPILVLPLLCMIIQPFASDKHSHVLIVSFVGGTPAAFGRALTLSSFSPHKPSDV